MFTVNWRGAGHFTARRLRFVGRRRAAIAGAGIDVERKWATAEVANF
jgi:hypothetical protein